MIWLPEIGGRKNEKAEHKSETNLNGTYNGRHTHISTHPTQTLMKTMDFGN